MIILGECKVYFFNKFIEEKHLENAWKGDWGKKYRIVFCGLTLSKSPCLLRTSATMGSLLDAPLLTDMEQRGEAQKDGRMQNVKP